MWAAMDVLRGRRKPMTATEIYDEIREWNFGRAEGRRPELTLAALLAMNAKRGPLPRAPEPGKFRLSGA